MKKRTRYSKDIKVPRFEKDVRFSTNPARSELMKKIRGKNTKPELILRKILWSKGYRYRINYKDLPGKPDILFKKYHIVVFVDGEFWHGYDWKVKKNRIKSNREFWIAKIEKNMLRDIENTKALELLGYVVIRFWQHEIMKDPVKCAHLIIDKVKNQLC